MDIKTDCRALIDKDIERLREIQKSIFLGLACTHDKLKCLDYLESIINPKCSVCRKPMEGEIMVVNGHKMHKNCRKRYPG